MERKAKRLKTAVTISVALAVMVVASLLVRESPERSTAASPSGGAPIFRNPDALPRPDSAPALPSELRDGFSNAVAVSASGIAVLCSDAGAITILKAATGEIVRRRSADADLNGKPVVLDDVILVGGSDGLLKAFDLKTLSPLWRFKTGGKIAGGAAFVKSAGGGVAVFGSYDFKIRGVDILSGKLKWSLGTDNFINGTPGWVNEELCVGGCDGKLRFLDPENGSLNALVDLGSYIPASPAVGGSLCAVALYAGGILVVDADSHKIVWRWSADGKKRGRAFTTSPVIIGDKVFAVSTKGRITALSFETGKEIWSGSVPCGVDAQPVAVADFLLVVDADGTVRIFDAENGRETAEVALGEAVSAEPAATEDGGFIVATEEGLVAAMRIARVPGRKPRVSRLWSRRLRFSPSERRLDHRAAP